MSSSAGSNERLKQNVEDQLNRLLQQLSDLDEMREDLEEAEYTSQKEDTLQQMKEFEGTLERLVSGDVTLVSQLDAMRNAVHAYVSGACRDPNITRLFATKSTAGLRNKLASLTQDLKLNRIKQADFDALALEVVAALEKLNEPLTPSELGILDGGRRNLQGYSEAADGAVGSHVIEAAKK